MPSYSGEVELAVAVVVGVVSGICFGKERDKGGGCEVS